MTVSWLQLGQPHVLSRSSLARKSSCLPESLGKNTRMLLLWLTLLAYLCKVLFPTPFLARALGSLCSLSNIDDGQHC